MTSDIEWFKNEYSRTAEQGPIPLVKCLPTETLKWDTSAVHSKQTIITLFMEQLHYHMPVPQPAL